MAGQFTQFGARTGHVDITDWDLAIARGFGAVHSAIKNEWYLPISLYFEDPQLGPVEIKQALVTFKKPEPTQVEFNLPEIAIIRDDIVPDPKRLFSPTVQYRQPAAGSTPVSVNGMLGYNLYETKDKERPYELVYTIECWSRYRTVAIMLLQIIMAAYPMRGSVSFADSIGCVRTYLVTQDGTSDLTEVSSLVDRVCGYSLTIRAEAELTLDKKPTIEEAFTGGLTPGPPAGQPPTPIDPNLPPGGLYGDGLATTRVTVMENEKS